MACAQMDEISFKFYAKQQQFEINVEHTIRVGTHRSFVDYYYYHVYIISCYAYENSELMPLELTVVNSNFFQTEIRKWK